MAVVATAGHVDHGKSALVRALTGTDPDRLPEERRRGLTIELGHAVLDLDGRAVALVDVPGHDRFVGTTIAGVGPAGGVLLVVAADEGWSAQTEEHVAAVRALGLTRFALVVTKTDLADGAPVRADALSRLARHGLAPLATALVSVRAGTGLEEVRAAIAAIVAATPDPDPLAPVRLWVDRSFSVTGAGTVVTGTLAAGTVRVGDVLEVDGRAAPVRGLQVHGQDVTAASGPTRLAVNLRGVAAAAAPRGAALVTAGSRRPAAVLDVVLHPLADRRPESVVLHVGTAAVPVRLRPLGRTHARLTLPAPGLPLAPGDRVLLRDPGAHEVVAGADVLATDPAPFSRRGDAARRAARLEAGPPGDLSAADDGSPEAAAVPVALAGDDPPALAALLAWLAEHPLAAAPAALLGDDGPAPADLARAEREGRLVRTGGVVLHGAVLRRVRPHLDALPDPFGPGDLARAVGTSRRVAVALLSRFDALGTTRRLPDGSRRVRLTP